MTYVIVFVAGFWLGAWLLNKACGPYDFRRLPQCSIRDDSGNVRFHAYFATQEDLDNSTDYINRHDYRKLPQYWMKDEKGAVRFYAYFATQEDLDNSISYVSGNK